MSLTAKMISLKFLLLIAALFAGHSCFAEDVERPLLPVVVKSKPHEPGQYRTWFIGNSITICGTNPELQATLGWNHMSGMAASELVKDFVHLVADGIQIDRPDVKVEIGYHPGGRNVAGALENMQSAEDFRPDLVVIQLGEHEKASDGVDTLRTNYSKLLSKLKSLDAKVISVGPWASGEDAYAGWWGDVQNIMGEEAAKHNVPFISVQDLASNPNCYGTGTSEGVKWHPNDAGHAGYASKILTAYHGIE